MCHPNSCVEIPCAWHQVSHIDITKESPCGHGVVICFSVYAGAGANLGECTPEGEPEDGIVQSQLWVDTMVDDAKDQVGAPPFPAVYDALDRHPAADRPVMELPGCMSWH